jgi:hypothetical protein
MKNRLAFTLASMLIFLSPVAQGQSTDTPSSENATPVEIANSAQRVYLDPQTGRWLIFRAGSGTRQWQPWLTMAAS